MRIYIIVIIGFNFFLSYGQDYDKTYFDSLLLIVSSDKSIKESKLYVKRYFNGKIKYQELRVKYKDDTDDRSWQLGKAISYYKHGTIKGFNNVDINHKVLIDSAISYNKDGLIDYVIYWLNDSDYTQIPMYAPFKKVWCSFPVRYRVLSFNNGRLFYDRTYCFNNGTFDLDGEAIFYKKDGTVDDRYKYKNGKKQNK